MRSILVAGVSVVISVGCTASTEPVESAPAPVADAAKAEPAKTEPAKTEPAKTEPAKTEPAATEPPKPEPPTEPPKPAYVQPKLVEDTLVLEQVPKVVPQPGTIAWQERPDLATIRDFQPYVLGVLADCGTEEEAWFELDASGKLVASKATDPEDEIYGVWPTDAWMVRAESFEESEDDEYRQWENLELLRWNGKRFARVAKFDIDVDPLSEMAGDPNYAIRTDWSGGLLVNSFGSVDRFTNSGRTTLNLPGDVYASFGTASGGVLRFTHTDRMYLGAPCTADGCAPGILNLPNAKSDEQAFGWEILHDAPRGGDAFTLLAEFEDASGYFLLHYDPPISPDSKPFSAEALDRDPDVIRPDAVGGLWMEANDGLWYRDAKGRWLEVSLPGRLENWAMRVTPREVLVLIDGPDGVSRVYAGTGAATPTPEPTPVPEPAPTPT